VLTYKGHLLKYQRFAPEQERTLIASSKQLNTVVDQQTSGRKKYKPSNDHPWKAAGIKKQLAAQATR
jgi:hypothetical protein